MDVEEESKNEAADSDHEESEGESSEGEKRIEQTPSEMAADLMLHADVPNLDQLLLEIPTHLKCLAKSQEYVPKSRKREVNYYTPHMATVQGHEPIEEGEVILVVAFYDARKGHKTQEFSVLGSQCLTELKDRFYCLSNEVYREWTTTSGYFFIENVFYNDMRSQDAMDYSDPIMNWVGENQRFAQPAYGIYSKRKMEATTFNDLSLSVGVPYLFCHRGNCEHVMIFHDIRLLHSDDELNKRAYPLQTFQHKIRRKKCRVCDIYPAKYVPPS